jgi:hypothetical protein
MSNLRLINETTITSNVSSVDITDVFSSDFDIYKVTINNASCNSSSVAQLRYRFINASGSLVSASNYDSATLQLASNTSSVSENREVNTTRTELITYIDLSADSASVTTYIFNPYSSSSYTFLTSQASSRSSVYYGHKSIAVLKQTASMTGLNVLATSNNIASGTIRTYGLRVDS